MVSLYGIVNCDTVRKARRWLDAGGISYRFHDLRRDGLEPARLHHWVEVLGWEALLNRRGTTWRQLPAKTRDAIDASAAERLMLERPTLIRRPVLEHGDALLVGFDEARYRALLRP